MIFKILRLMKKHRCFLIVLSFSFAITGCGKNVENATDGNNSSPSNHKSVNIPVYFNAKDLNSFRMKNGKIEGIKYEVKERYPAERALDFYEAEMNNLGYIRYVEEYYKYSDRTWQRFIDSTIEGAPYVARLTADWVNPEKTKRIKLTLNYYWNDYDGSSKIVLSDNEELFVTVQTMPFYTLPPPPAADNLKMP